MNIYVDESGSINNHDPKGRHFIISLVYVPNITSLKKSYKRFVSANIDELRKLDLPKTVYKNGKPTIVGGKMFRDDKFLELKGSEFDRAMKKKFIDFFSKEHNFEVFYIDICNDKLTDKFCENTARVFNYSMKIALECFLRKNLLPNEDCTLQLDERNEKTETKFFLENYLNTELRLTNAIDGKFSVAYFDSADNKLIQIADVFANIFYSQLITGNYTEEINKLKEAGFIKYIFQFPL